MNAAAQFITQGSLNHVLGPPFLSCAYSKVVHQNCSYPKDIPQFCRSTPPTVTREDSNASFHREDSVASDRAGNVPGIEGRGERGRQVISRVPNFRRCRGRRDGPPPKTARVVSPAHSSTPLLTQPRFPYGRLWKSFHTKQLALPGPGLFFERTGRM